MEEKGNTVMSLCRLCGSSSLTLEEVFTANGLCSDLGNKINLYLPVHVQSGDGLPGQCCWNCSHLVMSWHNLYLTCQKTEGKLMMVFKKVQVQENTAPAFALEEPEIVVKQELKDDDEEDCLPQTEEEPKPQETTPKVNAFEDKRQKYLNTLICPICGKKNASRRSLKKHVNYHNAKPVTCKICNKTLKNKDIHDYHVKVVHEKQELRTKYPCHMCGFLCEVGRLQQHLAKHSDERPYTCETCGKGFKFKNNLTRHLLIHSDLTPFKCKFCPSSFRTKSDLTSHQNVHPEARIVCELCGKDFSKQSNLDQHNKYIHKLDG